ncbi:hypothetical protein AWW66_11965 [Micromonospora rosaria]|uniref:Uncharacterized protein n=1 Tax=Micromonospora rosaria TaxID=47874 RepID=A0A136PTM0_9ACTN|nr:hypothetical protein [Micromonospora rosaria]KXK61715.1 hypothetical protein AWW66_11965 [Micromonospora rosaria]
MTADREAIPGKDRRVTDEVSTATMVAYGCAAVVLFGWFLFGWLVLQQGFVASVGEAAGAGFALLLAVTIIGSYRRSRR